MPKFNTWFFSLGVILLTISFANNGLNAVNQDYFAHFQTSSEGLIINRIVKNRGTSFTEQGGLTGWFNPVHPFSKSKSYAYYLYTEGICNEPFDLYRTHHGTQAIFYSILDQQILSFLSPANRFFTLHIITALLNSVILMLLLLQFKQLFNLKKTTLFVLVFCLAFAQFLVPFGNNLWWALGSFYIPFMACIWLFNTQKSKLRIVLFAALALFVKYLFTGYEYITTIWIMSALGCILSLPKITLKQIFLRTFYPVIGFIIATLGSVLLLVYQIKLADGTWKAGWDHLVFSFLKRSHGDSSSLPEAYAASLDAQLLPIIKNYFTTVWLDISHLIGDSLPIFLRVIKWWEIVGLFIVALVINKLLKINQKFAKVAIFTGISFLAPLSWLIIFKGHSYIHQHMNHIIWWMPTSFFILIYVCESLPEIWFKLKSAFINRTT